MLGRMDLVAAEDPRDAALPAHSGSRKGDRGRAMDQDGIHLRACHRPIECLQVMYRLRHE